jgi:multidrug efflux pump subunit AcrB
LQIVQDVLKTLPALAPTLPEDVAMKPMFDQSLFVKAAIKAVLEEALIAACLTATMLLLFLGNWRSTCIIAVSIPLSILSSILLLHVFGQTLNLMTLGGLALAVGILVDDATVEIENIERNLHLGKDTRTAILDGAAEIAVPAFVSTLCICIVFLPMFFLTGVARFLFVPMAEAVVFAMLASYLLSRTLVPTLVLYLMAHKGQSHAGIFQRVNHWFEVGFERFRSHYHNVLAVLLQHRLAFGGFFLLFCVLSFGLYPYLGRDFFPEVDAGQIKLHVRAPSGTRIEEMPALADAIEATIRELIPASELQTVLDNLGGPYTPVNTSYNPSGTIDTADAEIMVSLQPQHTPTAQHIAALRSALPQRFPGVEFFFQPADMVSQSLNFGIPAPIDVQISGAKTAENLAIALSLLNQIKQIPGAVDVHLYQRFNKPSLNLEMDRNRLQQVGLEARDVAQNLLISLSSSFQTAPTFWLNPMNGVVYNVAVQSRQHEIDSMDALLRTPVGKDSKGEAQLLGNLVQYQPQVQQAVVSRYANQPVIDVYVGVQGRDLGAVTADIDQQVEAIRAKLPRGSDISVHGQVQTMRSSFVGLGLGLVVAIALVYLLIVVNFQSWLDPLIIITALPAALAGIAWILFLSGTHLSVPALTGAIMTMGVATANSILLVSFAREKFDAGVSAVEAALSAGATRLRPVLMTALAMMIGMIPMAVGVGEAAEQNAPLGRAVIGGLLFATVSTLLFVPLVFASIHSRWSRARNLPS